MGCTPSKPFPSPPVSSFLSSPTSHHLSKLHRLHTPGVMVIVDVFNLEIEGRKLSHELRHHRPGIDHTWRMHYDHLLSLIATRENTIPARTIVAAHCISSETQLLRNRFSPSRTTCARLGITFTIPSSRHFPAPSVYRKPPQDDHRFTIPEKAVDHTLVRIMTQEFEGLQLLHGDSAQRPHRTIALVAGDFDYVDVVEQARLSGVDVEMWHWTGGPGLSTQWLREESRRHDRLGAFTVFDLRRHFDLLTAESAHHKGLILTPDWADRLSFGSHQSDRSGTDQLPRLKSANAPTPPSGLDLGKNGRRRLHSVMVPHHVLQNADTEVAASEGMQTPGSSVLTSEMGDAHRSFSEHGVRSPFVTGAVMLPTDEEENERCELREFCNQESCGKRHTEAERIHFKLHGGKGRYRLTKVKNCRGTRICRENERKFGVCTYLHEEETPLCVQCLQVHEERKCDVERIRPINPLEARPLVQDGYLVDLLVAKSAVGGANLGKRRSDKGVDSAV